MSAAASLIHTTDSRGKGVREMARRYRRVAVPPMRRLRLLRRAIERTAWSSRRELYLILKRQIDLVVSAFLLLVLSPLLLAVAIAIKLTDWGPVLHWQTRVGEGGRTFRFPKFRSMVNGAESMVDQFLGENHHGDSITFKIKRDPRVTPIGRIIRRFSVDELPQLWCVLRGDMCLVGPRPALPREVASYKQGERRRLEATPGLTCIWQVSGRADVPFEAQVQMDLDYIHNQSLHLDLKLLLLTLPAVLYGRGAY
jgi:lipopolysaccharide/colanic/teichoic acid biosynthesis glycosyltransferase